MENLILICVAIFLPLGLIVANKLIDRTTIKQKDDTIKNLTENIFSLTAEKENAQSASRTAQMTSQQAGKLSQDLVGTAKSSAPLMEQAKCVGSEADAIELARRQAEAQR